MTPELAAHVHDLLEQNRVFLRGGTHQDTAIVAGRTDWYRVEATPEGVFCTCQAALAGNACSHLLAAMAKWAEPLEMEPAPTTGGLAPVTATLPESKRFGDA